MHDLLLCLTVMVMFCMMAAYAGARLQRRAHWATILMCLMTTSAGMAAYMLWIWDRPLLTRVVPFSSAIILGNWLPVIGCFLVGICVQTERIVWIRRWLLGSVLTSLCLYSLVSPLLGKAPECRTSTASSRILEFQTTPQTCSAACAAGLLRMHGISATEEEMAELCLTRRGTHWLGVFRGLKIKTRGTDWDVTVEDVRPDQLTVREDLRGILSLTFLPRAAERTQESGFGADVGHTVISLGRSPQRTLYIFDPSPDYGFESWNKRMVEDVQTCILLRLVSRSGRLSPLECIETDRPSTWNTRQIAGIQESRRP